MKTLILFLTFTIITSQLFSQELEAYKLFEADGGKAKWKNLVKEAKRADVILFGELHNNSVVHWMQLELTKALFEEHKQNLVLGAEMFESDDQVKIDEYFDGLFSEMIFEGEVVLWKNYKTDIKPLLNFAKDSSLKFIATNVPRRYASMVSRMGLTKLDELSDEAKSYLPPLPIEYDAELPGYKSMQDMGEGHGMPHIAEAQAIKDATMAYFISKNISLGKVFLHYNGTYHSNNYEGINWYLKKINPDLKILTIASVEQSEINKLEEDNEGLADIIIVVPTTITKTH